MLRYQNKYRSTVRTRPEIVRRVMDRLNEQGRAFVSPYAQEAGGAELAALKNRAQESGDAHIGQLFESLDYLLARASIVRLLGMEMPLRFITSVRSSKTFARSMLPRSAEPY